MPGFAKTFPECSVVSSVRSRKAREVRRAFATPGRAQARHRDERSAMRLRAEYEDSTALTSGNGEFASLMAMARPQKGRAREFYPQRGDISNCKWEPKCRLTAASGPVTAEVVRPQPLAKPPTAVRGAESMYGGRAHWWSFERQGQIDPPQQSMSDVIGERFFFFDSFNGICRKTGLGPHESSWLGALVCDGIDCRRPCWRALATFWGSLAYSISSPGCAGCSVEPNDTQGRSLAAVFDVNRVE